MSRFCCFLLFLWFLPAAACVPATADTTGDAIAFDDPSEFFVTLPPTYNPARRWPVFIGVHGAGGSGRDCLEMWQETAQELGVVLICPSLADENGGWYTDDGDRKMIAMMRRLRQEFSLQEQIFIAGFSAGGDFAQAYSFKHPNVVAGAALLSSGSYHTPPDSARQVPYLVVVGSREHLYSVNDAQQFGKFLQQNGFSVEVKVLPGVEHTFTDAHRDLTKAFYRQVMQP